MREFASSIDEYGEYFMQIAHSSEDAEEPLPELAFERFKRAYLMSGDPDAIAGIKRTHRRIRKLTDAEQIGQIMNAARRQLSDEMTRFLKLAGE